MDGRVVRELPAPGMPDARETREVCPEKALVCGQSLEGRGRRVQQGLVRGAVRRAEDGSARCRDREGAEEVRPRELWVQVVLEPRLGCMLLTLGTVAVATGRSDSVLPPAVWALIKARAVMSAAAVLEALATLRCARGRWGEGARDSGAKAVQTARRVGRAGARP